QDRRGETRTAARRRGRGDPRRRNGDHRLMSASPVILAVGAQCSMARNALHLALLARSGRSRGAFVSGLTDDAGRNVAMFTVPGIPPGGALASRLAAIATPALVEALSSAKQSADADTLEALRADVPVFLALPDAERPEPAGGRVGSELVSDLAEAAAFAVDK